MKKELENHKYNIELDKNINKTIKQIMVLKTEYNKISEEREQRQFQMGFDIEEQRFKRNNNRVSAIAENRKQKRKEIMNKRRELLRQNIEEKQTKLKDLKEEREQRQFQMGFDIEEQRFKRNNNRVSAIVENRKQKRKEIMNKRRESLKK